MANHSKSLTTPVTVNVDVPEVKVPDQASVITAAIVAEMNARLAGKSGPNPTLNPLKADGTPTPALSKSGYKAIAEAVVNSGITDLNQAASVFLDCLKQSGFRGTRGTFESYLQKARAKQSA